ncbi:hypothetical protein ETB97_009530 [Aspergillus alliaceus]|uniref:Uncharacterized protein n=1 Tax=Petromyces alliaceus TaxID=209559 RepID=A0A8H5ZR25_PETAA|nr:hypothetical protein ETB97_009530 [Aspergillus burnettii]
MTLRSLLNRFTKNPQTNLATEISKEAEITAQPVPARNPAREIARSFLSIISQLGGVPPMIDDWEWRQGYPRRSGLGRYGSLLIGEDVDDAVCLVRGRTVY